MLRHNNYFADIDNDSKDELIIFAMEGSIGISSFTVIKQNTNGEYDLLENPRNISCQKLWYGANDIIKYNDKYYFVVVLNDFSFHYPSTIEIYSFDGIKLGASVSLISSIENKNINYIKAYESENSINEIQKFIDYEIENIMEKTIHSQSLYTGDEYKLNEEELKYINFIEKSNIEIYKPDIFTSDVNNDGINEYFYKNVWIPSSVNGQNYLKFELYFQNDNKDIKKADIYDYIKDKYLSGYLQQLFIKKFDNKNYLFLLYQTPKSKNFNLCVYKIDKENSELILSYLIGYPFNDIEINIRNHFENAEVKG